MEFECARYRGVKWQGPILKRWFGFAGNHRGLGVLEPGVLDVCVLADLICNLK